MWRVKRKYWRISAWGAGGAVILIPLAIWKYQLIFPAYLLTALGCAVWATCRTLRKIALPSRVRLLLALPIFLCWSWAGFVPLLPVGLFSIWYSDTCPERGFKVPVYELRGYPVRNVTFHRSYSLESFNFDITEQEFRELSRHFSQPLREITKTFHISVLEVPAKTWAETVMTDVSVEHGLYSEYRQSNGGGYLLVFDRDHDRGYYRCSPR